MTFPPATPKIFDPPISTSNLRAPDLETVWKIFSRAVGPGDVIESGKLVRELEERLCEYHDAKYCVAFSTGFWALVAACQLRALPGKSEIIIPSLTYRRLADVVYWTGHIPVFVDVEPSRLSICASSVEAMLSEETALILGVHPIVNCCDVDRLIQLAHRSSIPIVFDAVESVHETFRSRRIGSFGVGEVFSLHASKLINGVEGGYVCTNDEAFQQQLQKFRTGQWCPSTLPKKIAIGSVSEPQGHHGIPSILNDGHAAFAIAELDEIQANVDHNRSIYRSYIDGLSGIAGLRILPFDETEQTSFKNIVVQVRSPFPLSRDQLVNRLNGRGILARAHYSPALHTKSHGFSFRVGSLPNTIRAEREFLNLPCGDRVSECDVQQVCQILGEIASS